MPAGTIRLHDVIQHSSSGGTSLVRPPRAVTLDSGAVRIFLSPVSFNQGVFQGAINDGEYNFRNVDRQITRTLDNTRNAQAFMRIDTGRRLDRSIFRSNQISESDFRRRGIINFDLFRINVNQDAYITQEKILEALVIPEVVRNFLENLTIRIAGFEFDLIRENEIERILGSMVNSVNNFNVRITNTGRVRFHFELSNIRITLPPTIVAAANIIKDEIDEDLRDVCGEYFLEQLNVNLFLKVTPNRTVNVDDQINLAFERASLTIPSRVEVRSCPPANDNPNAAPDPSQWEELVDEIQTFIGNQLRTVIQGAVAAALSPLHNELMNYVNIEMEAEFDRMMDTVISETIAQNDDLIDVETDDITKTISRFRTIRMTRPDENGRMVTVNALKPELIYGVLTSARSSRPRPVIVRNPSMVRNPLRR